MDSDWQRRIAIEKTAALWSEDGQSIKPLRFGGVPSSRAPG